MKEILRIFAIVFAIGIIFIIPNVIKESKNVEKYNFNYITKSQARKMKKQNNSTNKESVPVSGFNEIYFEMDLRNKAIYTDEDYEVMLKGTSLQGLGRAFKKCDDIGINSLFMIALACHESNYGNSDLSKHKNNLFGFKAYDRDPYNSAKDFASKEECIEYVAKYIRDNYLSENGIYFNGYTISSINKKYATDKNWDEKIFKIMKKLENKI